MSRPAILKENGFLMRDRDEKSRDHIRSLPGEPLGLAAAAAAAAAAVAVVMVTVVVMRLEAARCLTFAAWRIF